MRTAGELQSYNKESSETIPSLEWMKPEGQAMAMNLITAAKIVLQTASEDLTVHLNFIPLSYLFFFFKIVHCWK